MLMPPPTHLLCVSADFMTIGQISGVGVFGFDMMLHDEKEMTMEMMIMLNMMKEMFNNVMKMFIILTRHEL